MRVLLMMCLCVVLSAMAQANDVQTADAEVATVTSAAGLCNDANSVLNESCRLLKTDYLNSLVLIPQLDGQLTADRSAVCEPSCKVQCAPTGGICTSHGCACF